MALPFGPIEDIRVCKLTVLATAEISVDFTIEDSQGNSATGYFFTSDTFGTKFTKGATYDCNAKLKVITNGWGLDPRLGIVDLQFGEEWLSEHQSTEVEREVVYNAPSRTARAYT